MQARKLPLVPRTPLPQAEERTRQGANGCMRPQRRPAKPNRSPTQPDRAATRRPGIASRSRDDGQRLALSPRRRLSRPAHGLADDRRGLQRTPRHRAPQPPGRVAIETLEILLRLLPRRCWDQQPGPARDQRHPRQPHRLLRTAGPTPPRAHCTSTASSPSTGGAATPACAGTSTPAHERLQSPTRHRPPPRHRLRPRAAGARQGHPRRPGRVPRPSVEPVLDAHRRGTPGAAHRRQQDARGRRALLGEHLDQLGHEPRRLHQPQPACPRDAGNDPRARAETCPPSPSGSGRCTGRLPPIYR